MQIELAYGKERLKAEIPDHIHTEVVQPRYVRGLPDQKKAISDALEKPVNHPPLHSTVSARQKVAIVFSDITRATPYQLMLPPLLEALSHLPDEHITFFCATGTHRPATSRELVTILGEEVVQRFRIVQNSASDPSQQKHVGSTSSGNNILLNKVIMEFDLRILTGFIEPHFFAGFSGGGKALMPGMASLETVRKNHAIRNLKNPKTRWGHTAGNPLWEEVMEAAELAAPLFLLNITLNKDKEITGVFAGELREAHKKGCAFVKVTAMAPVEEAFDIVITSNSGYPLDLNVYQSVKGMSAAERVVRKGGTIIMAAECWDGIPGASDYETILKSVDCVDDLMDFIIEHEQELQDTWQAYFQAMVQMKADVFFYSNLDDETVRSAHLKPVSKIDELVLNLVKKYGPDTRICVLPEGPHTIPYLNE
ncbi:MAG: nickel-dependent lactate racemase [Bacteroidetes bacterium]|nr:nickel-dependent lactate racemase [Bacteroidota bacterium]